VTVIACGISVNSSCYLTISQIYSGKTHRFSGAGIDNATYNPLSENNAAGRKNQKKQYYDMPHVINFKPLQKCNFTMYTGNTNFAFCLFKNIKN
jgi:hypothetical protein